MNDVPNILQPSSSRRTHNMMWSQGLRALCGHIMAATTINAQVVHAVQHVSACVALACYGGKFFYIDVEGSTRLPFFGLFYVPFNNLEDLVSHGLLVEAKLRRAYGKCATEGCELCHFRLHKPSFSQPTTMATVASTVLRHAHGSQLIAKVNERFPIHPPGHVTKNVDDIDGVLANLEIGPVDPKWVDCTI